MIYLDNAATSFPKPRSVIREVDRCLKCYCGNPGRGSHKLSLMAAEAIYSARESVASLLGLGAPEGVVFTYNATYALNIAIKSLATPNCHVITSYFEHNSVIRPLEELKARIGLEYDFFTQGEDIRVAITEKIRPNTTAIVCSLASNVTGDEVDLGVLSGIAKEYGLHLIVDASAAVGHRSFDLRRTPCDVFCAPGHKALYGIQGCGFAAFSDTVRKNTIIEGGSGSESKSKSMPILLPEGYEAGTLSTPAIVALNEGIKYVSKVGQDYIRARLISLTDYAEEIIRSVKNTTVYKPGNGVISFNIADLPSSIVACHLGRRGICVRGGLHCAPSIHSYLGTLDRGAIRLSFSLFNTRRQLDRVYKELKDIERNGI